AELGIAPQTETQRLHEAIRAAQINPPVARSAPPSTHLPEQSKTGSPRSSRSGLPPQLPTPTTALLGRADELAQIAARLADPCCLALACWLISWPRRLASSCWPHRASGCTCMANG